MEAPVRNSSHRMLRVGLALGGGGTRGASHIGVLRVLQQNGVPINCIAGTSMGAIVGALFCAGLAFDDMAEIVASKNFWDTFGLPQGKLGLAVLPVSVIPRALSGASYSGLFGGEEFATYLSSQLPPDITQIEQLPIPFAAITFNLLDGDVYAIKKGDIGLALQASGAVPELRQPVHWKGRLLVDGAVVANLPCEQTRELGADIVIAVNVNERLHPTSDTKFKSIGSVSDRCVTANLNKLDGYAEKQADLVIRPEVSGIKLLSRSRVDVERAILEGEKAASLAIPAILQAIKAFSYADPDRAQKAEINPH